MHQTLRNFFQITALNHQETQVINQSIKIYSDGLKLAVETHKLQSLNPKLILR